MKFTKKMTSKREKIVRDLLKAQPGVKNEEISAKVKAATGRGMGGSTIAEIRKHLPKGQRKTPPKETRSESTSEPSPSPQALEARPVRIPELDNRHVIVVVGDTDAVAEVLKKVFRG
jgi:hypothetical protein